jgi:hypothetical protein
MCRIPRHLLEMEGRESLTLRRRTRPTGLWYPLSAQFVVDSPVVKGNLKVVLKRGSLPFLGGLSGRLSFLCNFVPKVVSLV